MDELLPAAETLTELASYVGQYVAWGIGLAFIAFCLGYAIWFVIQVVRF